MGFEIGLLYVIVLVGGVALFASFIRQKNQQWLLTKEIDRLKKKVSVLELKQESSETYLSTQSVPNAAQSTPTPTPSTITQPIEKPVQTQAKADTQSVSIKEKTTGETTFSKKPLQENPTPTKKKPLLARPFLEGLQKNWIGIVGMAFFVLGFGFLGLYPSEKIAGLQKFILFAICSSTMFIATYFTAKMENWKNLSLWMRSGAGAIFLFACLGSAIIPGFIWAEDSFSQIMLLLIGIGINLLAGYTGKTQLIAMVHVLFSLIALAIIPASQLTLIIATLVTGFGIFLTYRKKWDINLLVVISEFFIFHLFWHIKIPETSITLSVWGLMAVFVILLAALFTHYRKVYSVKRFKPLPFLTHFLNWVYFAIGLAVYFEVIPEKAIFFLIAGLAAYLVARRGKKLKIRWLFITDATSAYFLVFMAVLTINQPQLNPFIITAILFLETVIFLFVASMEREPILIKIGYALASILGLGLIITFLGNIVASDKLLYLSSLTMIACLLSAGTFYYISLKKQKSPFSIIDKKLGSVISVLFSLIITVLYFKYLNQIWALWGVLALTVPLLLIRHKWKPVGNTVGLIILLSALSIGSWVALGMNQITGLTILKTTVSSVFYKSIYIAPLFIGMITAIIFSGEDKYKINRNLFVLITGAINFLMITSMLFNELSPFIPGILWLLAIIINLEISYKLNSYLKEKRYTLIPNQINHINYIIFACYTVRHIFVHLQSDKTLIGPIKISLLFSLLSVGVLIYWLFRSKITDTNGEQENVPLKDERKGLFKVLQQLRIELLYLFVISMIIAEFQVAWIPCFWIFGAIGTILLTIKLPKLPSRIKLYSIFLAWISFFHLAIINGVVDIPNYHSIPIKWIAGITTILLQVFYLVLLKKLDYHNTIKSNQAENLPSVIRGKINQWVFYPFFVALGIFIYTTFNSSVITLALIIESLIIFILSLSFKDNSFRYISLIAIAGCLIRLIFVDLFNSDMLIRAVVFIGVGVTMLLMNTLYLKFGKTPKEPDPIEKKSK